MLEKIENILYLDAHFHLFDSIKADSYDNSVDLQGCSCFLSKNEWKITDSQNTDNLIKAFGIHPLYLDKIEVEENLEFLEQLLKEKKISAVGEAGLDFFNKEGSSREIQIEVWEKQLALAKKYSVPLVVHCRKANELLITYTKQLSELPGVLFHSFMGTPAEAQYFIKHNVKAFFSFGKQLLNNNKKAISCMRELSSDSILCETDAPFQFLKGEEKTFISDIKQVYKEAFSLREDFSDYMDFCQQMENNFTRLYKNPVP